MLVTIALATGTGTALPIWRTLSRRVPWSLYPRGNPCRAAISGIRKRRQSQWKGPTQGPGEAANVHDGRSGESLRRKFQNLVSVTNVGLGWPAQAVWAL